MRPSLGEVVAATPSSRSRAWSRRNGLLCLAAALGSVAVIFFLLAGNALAAATYRVTTTATGTGDGLSWGSAMTLQQALTAAVSGDEIWVAEGTYRPTTTTDRTISFVLRAGVAVYGGFTTAATARSDRDWIAHVTTLSGDIGTAGTTSDNSYHVVNVPAGSGTILDGFTIQDGNANGTSPNNSGAGIYNLGSSTLRNLVITTNAATSSGGGLFNSGTITVTLSFVTFQSNTASTAAGHVGGAGIFNQGVDASHICTCNLTNVTFDSNSVGATGVGGGVYNHQFCGGAWTNVFFLNNSAGYGGGACNYGGSTVTITNALFYKNGATGAQGGGLRCDGSNATLTYVTFNQNTAGASYRALQVASGTVTLRNCVMWGDTGGEIAGTATVNYSDVQGGYAGTSNINADPLFKDAGGGDLHLGHGSPCIDAGDNVAPYTDLDETTRPLDGNNDGTATCDMGAYEAFPFRWYVTSTATGSGDGLSWGSPMTLQQAITASTSGEEIWVAAGTYKPTTTTDRTISFTLKSGVAIYGGFAGTEDTRTARDWATNVTILSGDIDNDGVLDGDNSYHVVKGAYLIASTRLDGFTITGGNANGGVSPNAWGGGVYLNGAYPGTQCIPTLANLIIENNKAGAGGALYGEKYCDVQVLNCWFRGNTADTGGAVISYDHSWPVYKNCLFTGNSATAGSGGALRFDNYAAYNVPATVNVLNCTFYNNTATDGAAILSQSTSQPVVRNCILWDDLSNGANEISLSSGTITVTYSDVRQTSGTYTGTGNINSDPLFLGASDFRLGALSPAIDTGTNTGAATTDFTGGSRPQDGDRNGTAICDMGAYENARPTVWYVTNNGAGSGRSWSVPAGMQSALSGALTGDEIWAHAGTYYPDASSRTVYFVLRSGIGIYGGFAGTETARSQRDWRNNVTVLSGDLNHNHALDSADSYHVVTGSSGLGSTTVLDGFTITGGNADYALNALYASGGGIYLSGSSGSPCSPKLENLTITGNSAVSAGGGINLTTYCSPIMSGVLLV